MIGRNNVGLPSSGISEKYFLFFNYFSKAPKSTKFECSFHFFSSKKVKRTPNLTKMYAFPTLIFKILILEMGRSLRATQHFQFSWPNNKHLNLYLNQTLKNNCFLYLIRF